MAIGKTNATIIIGGGDIDPTIDNKTHAFIRLTTVTGLVTSIHLNKTDTSTITIDWGDGSQNTYNSSGALDTGSHTYPSIGDYEITIWVSIGSGTYSLGMGYVGSNFIGGETTSLAVMLYKLVIGNNVTTIGGGSLYQSTSLENIYFSNSLITVGLNAVSNSYSLRDIKILGNMTTINGACFSGCYSIIHFSFPNSVTSISSSCFSNCYSAKYYKFYSTTPPTLANINSFQNINPICKIYVPDASIDTYKTATNWVTYANYIYPLSEIE